MAEGYGALEFPGATADDPAGDTALGILGRFTAFVLDNKLNQLWDRYVNGPRPIASRVRFNDPGEYFSAKHLPVLHIWCSEISKYAQSTDEAESRQRTLTWQWFFELATNEKQSRISPVISAIDAAIRVGIYQGRCPGFVVYGDTAVSSMSGGSPVLALSGVRTASCGQTRFDVVKIAYGASKEGFSVVTGSIQIVEDYTFGSDDLVPMALHQDYLRPDNSVIMTDPDEPGSGAI